MPSSLTILTGASRGMGAAMAEQVLAPDATMLCISRQRHPTLDDLAETRRCRLIQWQRDLSDPAPVAAELESFLAGLAGSTSGSARLINNAAALSRLGPIDEDDPAQLQRALRVGLEAPLLLSAAFLRGTRGWTGRRRILNISSGLGRRAMAGSAPYCSIKAGLDHLSRAMALDEAQRPNGAAIVSLAPGVIDTDMQVQLRAADDRGFPDKARFLALKSEGQLSSPTDAARRVLDFLDSDEFGQNVVADIRG